MNINPPPRIIPRCPLLQGGLLELEFQVLLEPVLSIAEVKGGGQIAN